jgi:hypothetical protein
LATEWPPKSRRICHKIFLQLICAPVQLALNP